MRIRLVAILVFASITLQAFPAHGDISGVDIEEEVLVRQVFDLNPWQRTRNLLSFEPKWPEWEDVYFGREKYRLRLEENISRNWAVGPWWWQTEVRIEDEDDIIRGGPIEFKIDYPWVDWRPDMSIKIYKHDGATKVRVIGKYFTPRWSYITAAGITLVNLAITLVIAGLVVFLAVKIFVGVVNAIAKRITGGENNPWARRFVACVLGCALCLATWTAVLVINSHLFQ